MVAQATEDLALPLEALGALESGLCGGRFAQAGEIPRMELPEVARGALRAEVLDRAIDHPVEFVEDLGARGLVLVVAQKLVEQPRVAERAAGEHDGRGARVLEHPADVAGRV